MSTSPTIANVNVNESFCLPCEIHGGDTKTRVTSLTGPHPPIQTKAWTQTGNFKLSNC